MKKAILIVIVLIFNIGYAQTDLINELLGLQYNYKTFHLNNHAKQVKIIDGISQGMGLGYKYEYKYTFAKNGNLISETYYTSGIFDNNSNINKYIYNDKNKLKEIRKKFKKELIEIIYFHYNKRNNIELIAFYNVKKSAFERYFIKWKKNKPIEFIVKNNEDKITYQSSNHKFDKNNNVIEYDFTEEGDLGHLSKKYDENNNLIYEKYVYKGESGFTNEVKTTLNKNFEASSKIEDGKTISYKYLKYDKQNNWNRSEYEYLGSFHIVKREFTYYE